MQFTPGIGIRFKNPYRVSFVSKTQRGGQASNARTDNDGFGGIQHEVNVRLGDTPRTTNLYFNCSIRLVPAHQNTLLFLYFLIGQKPSFPQITQCVEALEPAVDILVVLLNLVNLWTDG